MNYQQIEQIKGMRNELIRFMLRYEFALKEIETKIEILKEEFQSLHDYSPIEHTKSRVKSPESIMNKVIRKGCNFSLNDIQETILDIAGLRITTSFLSDIYRVSEMLQRQSDLKIREIKDYIKHPKPNGYQSLHLIVEVPVFLSDRMEQVCVEVQIRTIAMDFWASLEHKIFYKYNKAVPERLLQELKSAADTANALDHQMERLMQEVQEIKHSHHENSIAELKSITINDQKFTIPAALLELMGNE